jgi:ABC-type spermidine/putrescine transport system permease subunit II
VLIAGLAWGVVVFALSSCIGLPIAAALFDAGYPIANMASIVGYPTFIVEHLIYGAALGVLLMPDQFARP